MSTDARGDGRREPIREVSYGGVAIRRADGTGALELLVITPRGKRVTSLPKGGARRGESGAEAAAREVREETGVNVMVLEPLGDVRYRYRRGGRPVAKTVHFFLCDFVSGNTADHDHEVDEARWLPLASAPSEMSYPGERALIERALSKFRPDR